MMAMIIFAAAVAADDDDVVVIPAVSFLHICRTSRTIQTKHIQVLICFQVLHIDFQVNCVPFDAAYQLDRFLFTYR